MTAISRLGSTSSLLQSEEAAVSYFLKGIFAKGDDQLYVGTEWEIFFIKSKIKPTLPISQIDGQNTFAITLEDSQKAFELFKASFISTGYNAKYLHENGSKRITGLEINGLGVITQEIGRQFEFSSRVCEDHDEVKRVNTVFHRVASEVAQRLDYVPVYTGYLPGHSQNIKGGPHRNRVKHWNGLWGSRMPKAKLLREAQNGTAAAQVTVDVKATKFDEFFRALLLVEPAFSLHYANSSRSHAWTSAFERHLPGQVKPIVDVWNARTPEEAVKIIVGKLMDVEVPFLPDPERPGRYKDVPFINGRPATVRDLMIAGQLTENMLENAGSFAFMRPAFRKYHQGLLELRGIDSQANPEMIGEIARRVTALLYDDAARESLLEAYAHLSTSDIAKLHQASTMKNREEALTMEIAGTKIRDIIQDIINRSDVATPHMAIRTNFNPALRNRREAAITRLTA